MTDRVAVRILAVARFDDGTELEAEVAVPCSASAASLGDGAIEMSVSGTPSDPDALDRLVNVLTTHVDDYLGEAVPEADHDSVIARAAAAMLDQRGVGATRPRQEKIDRFESSPLKDEALEVLRRYLTLVGDALNRAELGTCWGVTVGLNSRTVLRVNVGAAEVMRVRTDRIVLVYLQGAEPTTLPAYAKSWEPGVKTGGANYVLWIDLDRIMEAFSDEALRAGVEQRIESSYRKLSQRSYHNPLTEQFRW